MQATITHATRRRTFPMLAITALLALSGCRSGALDQGRCDADFLTDMQTACDSDYPVSRAAPQNTACRVAAASARRASRTARSSTSMREAL